VAVLYAEAMPVSACRKSLYKSTALLGRHCHMHDTNGNNQHTLDPGPAAPNSGQFAMSDSKKVARYIQSV